MYDHASILLNEDEQLVYAVHARIAPTLTEIAVIVLCAPVALVVWLFAHRVFRSATYVITTQRVLVVEKQGTSDGISIAEIQRVRTRRRAMMIYGGGKRLWLPRLPDGWHFEAILNKVRQLT